MLHPQFSNLINAIYPALNDLKTYKEELIVQACKDEAILENVLYRDYHDGNRFALELMGNSRDFAAMAVKMLKVENY